MNISIFEDFNFEGFILYDIDFWSPQFFKTLTFKDFNFQRLQFSQTKNFWWLQILIWRLHFLKTLTFEDFNIWTSIFKDFNFWTLQFLKNSILKTSFFEEFNFEDFIFSRHLFFQSINSSFSNNMNQLPKQKLMVRLSRPNIQIYIPTRPHYSTFSPALGWAWPSSAPACYNLCLLVTFEFDNFCNFNYQCFYALLKFNRFCSTTEMDNMLFCSFFAAF